MNRSASAALVLATVAIAAAVPAYAQSTRRPDLNLFERGLREPEQSLVVRGNVGGTFYDTIARAAVPDGGMASPDKGWGTFASAALLYNVRLGNLLLDGTVGSYATYYPALAKPFRVKTSPGAGARAGWNWSLTDKTRLSLGSAVRLRPLYAEAAVPGDPGGLFGSGESNPFALGADPNSAFLPQDSAFVKGNYLSFGVNSEVRQELTRRWSVSALYDFQRDIALGVDPALNLRALWTHNAGAALHFLVARSLSVRGGYRYGRSRISATGQAIQTHTADVGVDYGDALAVQLTRRTRLSFGGGASGYVDRDGEQHYRLVGNVALTHDMGRTWRAGLNYARGVDSTQLFFGEPVLSDTFGASLNGLITRRLGFHATSRVQGGTLAFGSPERDTFRAVATAGVQSSLSRQLALGLDYTYLRYRFNSSLARPEGLADQRQSQAVYAYLSASMPILQRGRRPNAAR